MATERDQTQQPEKEHSGSPKFCVHTSLGRSVASVCILPLQETTMLQTQEDPCDADIPMSSRACEAKDGVFLHQES